jgi:hypothetical protein
VYTAAVTGDQFFKSIYSKGSSKEMKGGNVPPRSTSVRVSARLKTPGTGVVSIVVLIPPPFIISR